MTLRSYANFEEKLTGGSKKDRRIWHTFTRALESVKIGTLMGFFCPKQKRYDLKIYRRAMCHNNEMKNNAKFEEELTSPFKIDMRNLTNFDSSTPKSKKNCSLICSLIVQESCQVRQFS